MLGSPSEWSVILRGQAYYNTFRQASGELVFLVYVTKWVVALNVAYLEEDGTRQTNQAAIEWTFSLKGACAVGTLIGRHLHCRRFDWL